MTGSGTASLHATATVAQIQEDLAALVLTAPQAGIEATHLVGVTVHAA